MNKTGLAILAAIVISFSSALMPRALGEEFSVYQVYRPINLGEVEQAPPKDIFINMGTENGVKRGNTLDVYRKISSFDNLTQKHMGDHLIPVGRVKVIHVDERSSIARLDKFVSINEEPAMLPQAIMIGDVVKTIR